MTADPSNRSEGPSRSALLIVFLVVVIDLLGFGIVLPLLPLFAKGYVETLFPGGGESGTGGLMVGLLMASFSAMQFFFAPIWGRLSDRVGRRPILLLGLAGSVVFYALFGRACDLSGETAESARWALTLLFLSRIGAGIAGATISTAQAVIADTTPSEKRKHGMALIGAAFGIGFTIGPLVGFAALRWSADHHGAIGYTAAALSLIALVLGFFLLPETRKFHESAAPRRGRFDLETLRLTLGSPALAPIIGVFFLASVGFSSFEVTLSLLNRDSLGLQDHDNFLVFAYIGFVLLITQGFFYQRAARKLTEPSLMAIGISLMGMGVLALAGVTWLALRGTTPFGSLLTAQLASLTLAVVGFA
ncbi:MAG: MFS transporter, partial [Gemmataceae bacterium]